MIFALVAASATAALTLGLLAVFALLLLRLRVSLGLRGGGTRTVAFLHPFCNDGGGGERVLWVAIRDLLRESSGGTSSPWRVVVYTGDAASDDEIRAHAASRFGVHVPADVEFVRLKLRGWIEPKRYPVATLIGQALGSLVLAAEAVARCPPHTLVDTTGLHFCLPLLRLFGVPKLACYVHYPIISSDMIGAVQQRKAAHNNARVFARSAAGAQLKLAYYRLLVWVYAKAGRVSHATMANGSWTAGHIRALWAVAPALVFPPCDTAALQALPMEPPGGPAHSRAARRLVLSVAQFRPEKDHAKQIRSFATVLRTWQAMPAETRGARPTLVVAGAVRHADDERRLAELKTLAESLLGGGASGAGAAGAPADQTANVTGAIRFAPNLSLPELRELFGSAAVGLHTMWNEHFGIGVVEMCAAGIAVIAHNSGGPALDIIRDGSTGRLADTDDEYAEAMESLLLGPKAEARRAAMAAAGRSAVATRFSEQAFEGAWRKALAPALA